MIPRSAAAGKVETVDEHDEASAKLRIPTNVSLFHYQSGLGSCLNFQRPCCCCCISELHGSLIASSGHIWYIEKHL